MAPPPGAAARRGPRRTAGDRQTRQPVAQGRTWEEISVKELTDTVQSGQKLFASVAGYPLWVKIVAVVVIVVVGFFAMRLMQGEGGGD